LRIADFPFAQYLARVSAVTLCDDILTDTRVDEASRASLTSFGARAAAFLPLTSGNQRLGYLRLTWARPRTFTPAEARLYEATARNASVSVSNRLLFEQTQKRADREAIINTINQKIQSATSVEGALQIAAREIGQRLKARRATVELGESNNH
jgi:GAF domain-containing protein